VKKFLARIVIAALIAAFQAALNPVCAAELPKPVAAVWNKLYETMERTIDLKDRHESLPDSAWIGADKTSNAKKIDELLDRAMELLLTSEVNEARIEMRKLQETIPAMRRTVEEYRNKRLSAPVKTKLPYVVKTVKDYDDLIAETEEEIANATKAVAGVRSRITDNLRSYNLRLDDDQLDVLLTSVVGDDLLKNAVIFENVRTVTMKLMELAGANRDDMAIARRYYGMYVVLIDVLIHTQNEFIRRIDEGYIPRIGRIGESVRQSLEEARTALAGRGFSETQRKILNANIESNTFTLRAAKLYEELLGRQRSQLVLCLHGLERDRRVAKNTYDTVRHSSDLSEMIQSGLKLFDALIALQIPEIQTFENAGVRREFEELTRRLRE
jgi:hypothetical protein